MAILLESQYQAKVIQKIQDKYPGAIVLKTDPTYIIGFPDILILNGRRWAALEAKRSISASHGNNQDYYVNLTNEMSYGSFIYPENESEVLRELQQTFRFSQ